MLRLAAERAAAAAAASTAMRGVAVQQCRQFAAAAASGPGFMDTLAGVRDRVAQMFGRKGATETELSVDSFLQMVNQQRSQHEARLDDSQRQQLEFSHAAADKVFGSLSKEERKQLESLPEDADAYRTLPQPLIKRLRQSVPEGGVGARMVEFQLGHYMYFKAAMSVAARWRDAGNKEPPSAEYIGMHIGAPPVPPMPKPAHKMLCTCGSGKLGRNCCYREYVVR